MTSIIYSTATTFFLISMASILHATEWKKVGWWEIEFYEGSGGCSASAEFSEGTAFFIGLTGEKPLQLEILIANNKWKAIEDRKEYNIEAKFGDETLWTLNMNGLDIGELTALSLRVDAQTEKAGTLVDEFMRETNMEWSFEGKQLGVYSLKNSRGAFEEMVNCTKSYRNAVAVTQDPFSLSSPSNDPFE